MASYRFGSNTNFPKIRDNWIRRSVFSSSEVISRFGQNFSRKEVVRKRGGQEGEGERDKRKGKGQGEMVKWGGGNENSGREETGQMGKWEREREREGEGEVE